MDTNQVPVPMSGTVTVVSHWWNVVSIGAGLERKAGVDH